MIQSESIFDMRNLIRFAFPFVANHLLRKIEKLNTRNIISDYEFDYIVRVRFRDELKLDFIKIPILQSDPTSIPTRPDIQLQIEYNYDIQSF